MTTWWHWIPNKAVTLFHAAVFLKKKNKPTNKQTHRPNMFNPQTQTYKHWLARENSLSVSEWYPMMHWERPEMEEQPFRWLMREKHPECLLYIHVYVCRQKRWREVTSEGREFESHAARPLGKWSPCEREKGGLVFNAPLGYFTQVHTDERCTVRRRRSLHHSRKSFALRGS